MSMCGGARPSPSFSRRNVSPSPGGPTPSTRRKNEIPTLVEFLLTDAAGATQVVIRESGFDMTPAVRRAEAFRMNKAGWAAQKENLRRYVEG